MAAKKLNAIEGFSVGPNSVAVIDSVSSITANAITANGNITFTGPLVSLGSVANLEITGGNTNQVLSTDGTGNLVWIDAGTSSGSLVYIGTTPPSSPSSGQLWWDNQDGNSYIRYNDGDSTQWVLFSTLAVTAGATGATGSIGATGPAGSGDGATGATGATGASGFSGYSGYSGTDGIIGVDGATGATGPIGATGPAGTGGGSSVTNFIVTGTTQLAEKDYRYILTNEAPTTVTLLSTPAFGDTIYILVSNGLSNNIVARNGSKIMGLDEDLTIDGGNDSIGLLYVNSTLGWRLI